jgi:hypothetical protein
MEGLFKNDTLESMCKDKPSLAEREREMVAAPSSGENLQTAQLEKSFAYLPFSLTEITS